MLHKDCIINKIFFFLLVVIISREYFFRGRKGNLLPSKVLNCLCIVSPKKESCMIIFFAHTIENFSERVTLRFVTVLRIFYFQFLLSFTIRCVRKESANTKGSSYIPINSNNNHFLCPFSHIFFFLLLLSHYVSISKSSLVCVIFEKRVYSMS